MYKLLSSLFMLYTIYVASTTAYSGELLVEYEVFKKAVSEKQPINELKKYFADEYINKMGAGFNYSWLEQLTKSTQDESIFVEKTKGNVGCLAYPKPYKAGGEWVELYIFSYEKNGEKWTMTDATYSISEHHNKVASKNYCLTLGWPWN